MGDDDGLFEVLASLSDAMLFVTDFEANSLWVNERLVELTGYTLEDYRFNRFENPFIPPEDVAKVTAFLTEFLESGERVSAGVVHNRFTDRWGGTLHVRTRVARIAWEGSPALLYETRLDHEASSPSDAERRYRSLVEAASDAIVRLRSDFTFDYSNRRFQSIVGRDPVALNKTSLPSLVRSTERETIERSLREAMEDGRASFELTVPVRRGNGERAWLEGRFVAIPRRDGESNPPVLQAVLRDTTERRRLDAYVQQAQKRASLAQLAGGFAHDLNNILASVLGSASLLQEEFDEGMSDPDTVSETVSAIRLSARRAAQLASSMLAYAGEGNTARAEVDLRTVVGEMDTLLRAALPKGVELEISVGAAPAWVLADETQLRQVVMNLITNAGEAQAGTGGGEVRVELFAGGQVTPLEGQHFGPRLFGPAMRVRVTDRGPGFDPETAQRIFEPFFSTKGKGRGLGLAAVLGILERHGGSLTVDSAPGHGTTFELALPAHQPTASAPPPAPPPLPSRKATALAKTVLIVDDEALLRRLIRRTLEPRGFSVLEAGTGEEGLAQLETNEQVDVVLLDQTMPGIGGAEALVKIREKRSDLPVIRVSGFRADTTDEASQTYFLGKPFEIAELVAVLERALSPG